MESRCMASVIMGSTRSGGGVRLRGDGLRLLGHRGLLVVALLFVTVTMFVIGDVHCSITTDAVVAPAPAPVPTPTEQQTQPIVTFYQYEADAMNAIFQKWTKQNPELSTLFNWNPEQHPCNNLTRAFEKETGNDFIGAWKGVGCTSKVQNLTETPKHYQIMLTFLEIIGRYTDCQDIDPLYNSLCGFNGIIGQLPLEIINLTNLNYIEIDYNPQLTGPVPIEIFQLPYLNSLILTNNSLSGTLPSNIYNTNCKLDYL